MEKQKVLCCKGAKAEDEVFIYLEPDAKLEDVRAELEQKGFLPRYSEKAAYLFVIPKVALIKKGTVTMPLESEAYVPYQDLLRDNATLILTNVLAEKKPDLVGFGTDWWFNRYLGVQCRLNKSDTAAKEKNKDKFEPIMMTDVITTHQTRPFSYGNVCVCCEDSLVEFTLSSWGNVGFSFHIGSEIGEPIVDELLLTWGYPDKDLYGQTTIRRWQSDPPQTISIIGSEHATGIIPGQVLKYQKISFKTRSMTSYVKNGKSNSSNTPPPIAGSTNSRAGGSDAANNKNLANASKKEVIDIPGKSVDPGIPAKDKPSEQKWGTGLTKYTTAPWEEALGEVIVFFFVFKSLEEAKRIIDRYNLPNENLWK